MLAKFVTCNFVFVFFYDVANLVPNVTGEVYFVVQLLTARGISPESRHEEDNGKETINITTYITFSFF